MSRRDPAVQRRLRHGPLLPAEETRARLLGNPFVAFVDRLRPPPDWLVDLVFAFAFVTILLEIA